MPQAQHNHKTLEGILGLSLNTCEVHLCLASLIDGDMPDFQRVSFTHTVADDFRQIIVKEFDKYRRDLESGDVVLPEYDPSYKLDSHEVEHLDLSRHNSIKDQIAELGHLQGLPVFADEKEFVDRLRFYVIVIVPKAGTPVLCFRIYSPKKELSRSNRFALVLRKGQYDRVEDNLFLFDRYIDCVARDNHLFIFKKDNFQKIFQFYELLVKTAKETLKIIQEKVPIDDFASFEAACEGHLQKLAKIKNIASKPYLNKLTMANLKKVIKKFHLPIETVGKGKTEQIKFNASDKWAILRLLDDDYLESVMTGNKYETNSKRTI